MVKKESIYLIFESKDFKKNDILEGYQTGFKLLILKTSYRKWYKQLFQFITFGWYKALYKAPYRYKCKLID